MFLFTIVALGTASAALASEEFVLTDKCLSCICEALSSCDIHITCSGAVCGPFSITKAYWNDAKQPTVNNEPSTSPTAYANCSNNSYCAALAVRRYMQKFQRDCNKDGKVNCDDFVMIHKLGPSGCIGGSLQGTTKKMYERCKTIIGVDKT